MSREKFTAVDFKAEMEREHGYAVDAVKKWQYQVDRNRELEQELRDLNLVMHDLMHEKLPWWLANIAMEEQALKFFVNTIHCHGQANAQRPEDQCAGDVHRWPCTRARLLRAIFPEQHDIQVNASWEAALLEYADLMPWDYPHRPSGAPPPVRPWGIYDDGIHPASNRYVGVDLGAQPGDDRSVVGVMMRQVPSREFAADHIFTPLQQNAIMDAAAATGATPEQIAQVLRDYASENDT